MTESTKASQGSINSSPDRRRLGFFWLAGLLCSGLLTAAPQTASPEPSPAESKRHALSPNKLLRRAPRIRAVQLKELPEHLVKVTWRTNKLTTGQVEYDLDEAYALGVAKDPTWSTKHSVLLKTLIDGVTYHVRIRAQDAEGHEVFSVAHTIEMASTSSVSALASEPLVAHSTSSADGGPVIVKATQRPQLTEQPRQSQALPPTPVPDAQRTQGSFVGLLSQFVTPTLPSDNVTPQEAAVTQTPQATVTQAPTTAVTQAPPVSVGMDSSTDASQGHTPELAPSSGVEVSPPIVTITDPTTAPTFLTNKTPIEVRGRANDERRIVKISWRTDRGAQGLLEQIDRWRIRAVPLQEGPNTLVVEATDEAGKIGAATLSIALDTIAPDVLDVAVSKLTPRSAIIGWRTNEPAESWVTYGRLDQHGGVRRLSRQEAPGTLQHVVVLPDLQAETTYAFHVHAEDEAGNIATSARYELTTPPSPPDATPPTITILSPTGAERYMTNIPVVTLGGIAADDVGVSRVTWRSSRGAEGVAKGTTRWQTDAISLGEGETLVTMTAEDEVGNQGRSALTVLLDTVAPSVAVTFPRNGAQFGPDHHQPGGGD